MFYKTIITFQLLIFYFTAFGQENIDANQLMEFSKETIIDYFQVELEEMDTIYFLTDVKNDNGIIIFSLAGLEFDQPNIIIATENNLKHRVGKNTMEIIYHLVIDDNKRDTLDIHIEEYGLEYKKFLIFGKLTRYWICKGGGHDFTDGRFVFNSIRKEWDFISGRQKTEQYWEEKRNDGH